MAYDSIIRRSMFPRSVCSYVLSLHRKRYDLNVNIEDSLNECRRCRRESGMVEKQDKQEETWMQDRYQYSLTFFFFSVMRDYSTHVTSSLIFNALNQSGIVLRCRDSILPHVKIATFEFSRKFLNLIYDAVKIRRIVTVNYSRINVWRNNVSRDWPRQKYILIHFASNCPLSFFSFFFSPLEHSKNTVPYRNTSTIERFAFASSLSLRDTVLQFQSNQRASIFN